jgi:hypothetical protein
MSYFTLFWNSRLYGDAALQLFFAAVAAWGWWQWMRGHQDDGSPLRVRMLGARGRLLALGLLALAWPLTGLFLDRYKSKFRKPVKGVADSALKILASYWWPGNIRELENLIERLVAVSDKEWITDEDLPYELHVAQLDTSGPSAENLLDRAVSTFERNFIIRALEKSAWNVTGTARSLGIPLSTLKFKMDKLEIRELARKIRGN